MDPNVSTFLCRDRGRRRLTFRLGQTLWLLSVPFDINTSSFVFLKLSSAGIDNELASSSRWVSLDTIVQPLLHKHHSCLSSQTSADAFQAAE